MSFGSFLEPIERKEFRELPKFAVSDIEARDWINFLIIGYATKNILEDGTVEKVYERFLDIHEYCDWIFSKEQKRKVIIFHFGGKYDFLFLMAEFSEKWADGVYETYDYIPRGSGFLSFKVSKVKRVKNPGKKKVIRKDGDDFIIYERTIVFKDSSAILPFSLEYLTKNFGVEHKKKKIDFKTLTKVTPEVEEYLSYDNFGLYEVIEKFYDFKPIREAGFSSTIASQAVKVFQTYLKKPLPRIPMAIDSFVRESYFGGRTEIFKPMFNQLEDNHVLKTYDVNSLYPYVMQSNEFPVRWIRETNKFEPKCLGFYDVMVKVPKMYIPPLGLTFGEKEFKKYIFPTGIFRGKWSSVELLYAMSLGAEILEVYEGHIFENYGFIFKDFINDLYQIRMNNPKDSAWNIIAKLMMNCTYGRFGLNPFRQNLTTAYEFGLEEYAQVKRKGSDPLIIYKKEVCLDKSFTNPAIAAWVTSLARIHIHKQYMLAPEHMYMTDTDSLFTTADYECDNNVLGKLKFEYSSSLAYFLLPKTYYTRMTKPMKKVWGIDGEIELDEYGMPVLSVRNIVAKGFSVRKTGAFTEQDFYLYLQGEISSLKAKSPRKIGTFATSIRHGEYLRIIEEADREIKAKYNKRRIVSRSWCQGFDSEPLHIMNNKIVN